jgi:hypothetical protein
LSVAIVDIASLEVFGLRRRYMLTVIDRLGSDLRSSLAPSIGGLSLPETAIILEETTTILLLWFAMNLGATPYAHSHCTSED